MTVAIIGTDGIPNRHGGFERLAEHLAVALKQAGYHVIVYNSREHPYPHRTWQGVEIVKKTTLQRWLGSASLFLYDFLCLLHARRRRVDVVVQLGYTTSAIFQWLLPRRTLLLTNMDGLEWLRSKYGPLTRKYLHFAERLAAQRADHLIADHPVIADHLKKRYGRASTYIPYGADFPSFFDENVPRKYGLETGGYLLLVARMQPDNHIREIIEGCLQAGVGLPLVVVGSTENGHGRWLRSQFDVPNVRFLGGIYEKNDLDSLRHFSLLQFHGHSAGGTNPSLLEAMAAGPPVCAHDNGFNRYVLGGNGYFFLDKNGVAAAVRSVVLQKEKNGWAAAYRARLEAEYRWGAVTVGYLGLVGQTHKSPQ